MIFLCTQKILLVLLIVPYLIWTFRLDPILESSLDPNCLLYIIENQNDSISFKLRENLKLISDGLAFTIPDLPSSSGSDVRLSRHRGSCAVFFIYKINLQLSIQIIPKTTFALEQSIPFLIFQETIPWAQITTDKLIPPVIQVPLVFITESPRQILMYCILCLKSNSLQAIKLQNPTKNTTLSPLSEIHSQFRTLNGQGYGHKAYIYSSEYGELNNLQNETCYTDYLFKSRPEGCYMSQIFFNQAGNLLNISFQPTNSIEPSGRRKGLYVALVFFGSSLNENSYLHYRPKIYREWSDKLIFFYIRKNIQYGEEKTWIILLEPLDKYIWLGLLSTIGAISIYYRSLHAGFEVVKCSLLQPMVRKRSIVWASLILVTVVSYEYQAIVTRDMIAKPPLARVTDINVLLRMGYRYFTDSGISIATLFPAVAEALEIKDFYRDIPGYEMYNVLENLELMEKEKGFGAMNTLGAHLLFMLNIQDGIYDLGNRKLYVIKGPERQDIYVHWTATWNLSEQIFKLMKVWKEFGISWRWEKDNRNIRLKPIVKYANAHTTKKYAPERLGLWGTFRFIFFVSLCFLCVAFLTFFSEVVYGFISHCLVKKLTRWWREYRIKLKYYKHNI